MSLTAEIKVYSKPSCVQCDATARKLHSLGLLFEKIDITLPENAEALEHIQELGYHQVPVVEVRDMHWGGYSPDRLKKLAQVMQRADNGNISHLKDAAVEYMAGAE